MKLVKMSLVAALLASSGLFADETSDIEVSANIALTSNYIWRGMTQSDDSPAVQGGFDLGYKGFYAGVWIEHALGQADDGMEMTFPHEQFFNLGLHPFTKQGAVG